MTGVWAEKDIRAGAASRVMHSGVKAFRRHREGARRNYILSPSARRKATLSPDRAAARA